jgi:hypothetical protein
MKVHSCVSTSSPGRPNPDGGRREGITGTLADNAMDMTLRLPADGNWNPLEL